MPFTSENARALGARGGASKANRKLSLDRVERELGQLASVEDAMRRLDRLNVWIASGLLSGSQGSAAVRAVEVWLRGHESRLTEQVVEELTSDVRRLQTELGGKAVRAV